MSSLQQLFETVMKDYNELLETVRELHRRVGYLELRANNLEETIETKMDQDNHKEDHRRMKWYLVCEDYFDSKSKRDK